MGFGGMIGGTLGCVKLVNSSPCQTGIFFRCHYLTPDTRVNLGFFLMALALALRAPDARMAPARSIETPCLAAIFFWTALKPGCFLLATLLDFRLRLFTHHNFLAVLFGLRLSGGNPSLRVRELFFTNSRHVTIFHL